VVVWHILLQKRSILRPESVRWSEDELLHAQRVLNLACEGLELVGYGLLLLAIFGWRNRAVIRREELNVSLPRGRATLTRSGWPTDP
jgi:hypothetical protein